MDIMNEVSYLERMPTKKPPGFPGGFPFVVKGGFTTQKLILREGYQW